MEETTLVKATINRGYKIRLGSIAAMCLIFGGWFFYDGFVEYPNHNEKAEEFLKYREANRLPEWERTAKEKGWSTENPGAVKGVWDLRVQKILGAFCTTVGLFFGSGFIRARGRWVACDQEGLSTNKIASVPFGAIQSVDSSRWKTKGIAYVLYDVSGQSGRIILDDWKFDRPATTRIYEAVQSHLKSACSTSDDQGPPDDASESTPGPTS